MQPTHGFFVSKKIRQQRLEYEAFMNASYAEFIANQESKQKWLLQKEKESERRRFQQKLFYQEEMRKREEISNIPRLFQQHIKTINIEEISGMRGIEFERFCSQLLSINGYSVSMTKTSGDQGVDLLAHKDGKRFAIQCKGYKGKIGNSAVQQAFAGKSYYSADIAIVMANNRFTESAVELANKTHVVLWDIDNISRMAHHSSTEKQLFHYYLSQYRKIRGYNADIPIVTFTDSTSHRHVFDNIKTNIDFDMIFLDNVFERYAKHISKGGTSVFYSIKSIGNKTPMNAYYFILPIIEKDYEFILKQFGDKHYLVRIAFAR